jgi:hypothetical protein
MNHSSVITQTVMVNNITSHNNINHSSVKPAMYIVYHYCLMFDRGVVFIVVAGDIVSNYCLMFDRGVVNVVAVILLPVTISGLTEEWFILLWLVMLLTITV